MSIAVIELGFSLAVIVAEKFEENAFDYGHTLGRVFSDLFFPILIVNQVFSQKTKLLLVGDIERHLRQHGFEVLQTHHSFILDAVGKKINQNVVFSNLL